MCFYHDSDWQAEVSEQTTLTATKPVHCDECRRTIAVGDGYVHVYQQQYEEPLEEDGDCGETYDYDRCLDCDRLLRAIAAVEKDRGCPPYSALPALTELREAMEEDGADYAARAVEMFPDLSRDYLDMMLARRT